MSETMAFESLPKGWKAVTLNTVLSKVIDNRGKTPPFAENGAHELIEIASLRNVEKNPNYSAVTKYVSANVFESWFRDHIKDEDILVSTVGSVGLSALMEERRGAIAQNLIALRTNDLCDAGFLFNWTRSSDCHKQVRRVVMDAVQPSLKVPHFLRCFVSFPPLPEQRKIASILTTVDRLIEQTEALIEKYRRVKQGMMADLLSRGVDEHGKLRPTQRQAPELYKQSELGWIPKEWEVVPFSSLIRSIQLGTNLLGSERNNGIPLLKMGNLARGGFAFKKLEYLASSATSEASGTIANFGDFLFNTRNTLDIVGKSAVWRNQLPVAAFNSNIMRIKFNPGVNDFFVGYYFENSRGWAELKRIATGTTSVAAIYTRDLLDCLCVNVPFEEQTIVAERLDSIEGLIQQSKEHLAKIRMLKTGLMQDLLTGKVRVKVDEDEETMQPTPSSAEGVGV